MSTNQSRQDELNALRERGVASNHRGKYSASSSFMSPEEAAAFLSEQRSKRKSYVLPSPPNNLSSADLNDWHSLQRQRDLEERKRREEAEAFLRGYRGFVDTHPAVTNERSIEKPVMFISDAKSRVYSKVQTATPTVDDVTKFENVDVALNNENVDTKNIDNGSEEVAVDNVTNEDVGNEDKHNDSLSKEGDLDANIEDQLKVPDADVVKEIINVDDETQEKAENEKLNNLVPDEEIVNKISVSEDQVNMDAYEEVVCDEIVEGGTSETESIKVNLEINDEKDLDEITAENNENSNAEVEDISDRVKSLIIEEKKVEEINMKEEVNEENATAKEIVDNEDEQWNGWISKDKDAKFTPESGRYHLYLSAACPYSHAVMLVRKLKGLEDIIGVTYLDVTWKKRSFENNVEQTNWAFADGETNDDAIKDRPLSWGEPDPLFGSKTLKDMYEVANDTTGKHTIPLLWDKQHSTIVNNKSFDIIRIMNCEFNSLCQAPELDLYPKDNRMAIDAVNEWIYPNLNDGVFRCGSATCQEEYDRAVDDLTESFDRVSFILQRNRYLTGSSLSEADIRLFVTMLRFDEVYYILFKTNTRKVALCPPILDYIREIYQMKGVAETCDMDLIKTHYFTSHAGPNTPRIIPKGDGFIDLLQSPHKRSQFTYLE